MNVRSKAPTPEAVLRPSWGVVWGMSVLGAGRRCESDDLNTRFDPPTESALPDRRDLQAAVTVCGLAARGEDAVPAPSWMHAVLVVDVLVERGRAGEVPPAAGAVCPAGRCLGFAHPNILAHPEARFRATQFSISPGAWSTGSGREDRPATNGVGG